VPPLRLEDPARVDPWRGAGGVRGALVPGASGVNAARVAARAWTLGVRDALAELADVRLRWCLLCARVGLWGWQPLTPSMPITFVCADRPGCQRRQAVREARTWRGWRLLA
jgi:hypothetical protein